MPTTATELALCRIAATTDGLLVYDSLVGTIGALRFKEPTTKGTWQEFEFYRQVSRSGEMQLLFDLKGIGNVWLDDLRVTAIQPAQMDTAAGESPPSRR